MAHDESAYRTLQHKHSLTRAALQSATTDLLSLRRRLNDRDEEVARLRAQLAGDEAGLRAEMREAVTARYQLMEELDEQILRNGQVAADACAARLTLQAERDTLVDSRSALLDELLLEQQAHNATATQLHATTDELVTERAAFSTLRRAHESALARHKQQLADLEERHTHALAERDPRDLRGRLERERQARIQAESERDRLRKEGWAADCQSRRERALNAQRELRMGRVGEQSTEQQQTEQQQREHTESATAAQQGV